MRELRYCYPMKNGHCFQTKHAIEAYSATRELWNTPLFESPSFVALPTVGALVEGWLLVVPKVAALSFAQLATSQFSELAHFLGEVCSVLEASYGTISVFEHGPSVANSTVGCGVDHAHLHLVPAHCDLLTGAQRIAPNIKWTEISSFEKIRHSSNWGEGYWFLQQDYGDGKCYVGKSSDGKYTSQLFRRVIADHLGCPSAYDWKIAPGEAMISATVEKLSGHTVLA